MMMEFSSDKMEFSSDDKTTVIKSDQRTVAIKDNQVKYLKPILKEARVAIYEKMTLDQPWLGQSTTLHWNDPMLSDGTYYILREWKTYLTQLSVFMSTYLNNYFPRRYIRPTS